MKTSERDFPPLSSTEVSISNKQSRLKMECSILGDGAFPITEGFKQGFASLGGNALESSIGKGVGQMAFKQIPLSPETL